MRESWQAEATVSCVLCRGSWDVGGDDAVWQTLAEAEAWRPKHHRVCAWPLVSVHV